MNNPYSAPGAAMSDVSPGDQTYDPSMFAFSGRIGRVRYLGYSMGLSILMMLAVGVLGAILTMMARTAMREMGFLVLLVYIPLFAIHIILAKRRLNDLDQSGWLALLVLIPFVNFIFGLYLVFAAGSDGENGYGPAPSKNTTGVILLACTMPIIAVIGILAAIALPAYQTYVNKSRAAAHAQAPAPDAAPAELAPAPDATQAPDTAPAQPQPGAPADPQR
ncbi:MAG: DUF805 domain-containing protein [Pseudomonadota bacterium]